MSPQDRLRVIPRYRPELASFDLGSINFSIHPVAKRYKAGDYKYDWEQSYAEGTKDFIFETPSAIWRPIPPRLPRTMCVPNSKPMTWDIYQSAVLGEERHCGASFVDSVCFGSPGWSGGNY